MSCSVSSFPELVRSLDFGLIVLVVGLQQVKVVDRVIHVILPHQIIGVLAVGDVQIDKSNAFVTA